MRYTGPRCRRARRVGSDLFLTSGLRPLDQKCKLSKTPGVHGAKKTRISDYGVELNKQRKIRWTYGISSKTLSRYYEKATKQAVRQKGDKIYSLVELVLKSLEARLDNLVFRMGFAATRAEARQLVTHQTVWVNHKIVDIPSYSVKPGDTIGIRDKSKNQTRILAAIELAKQRKTYEWLSINSDQRQGIFKSFPDLKELAVDFQE